MLYTYIFLYSIKSVYSTKN